MRRYRFELAVLVVAAMLRIAGIATYGEFTQPQLYEYGGIARHILAGQGYAHVFPILHPEYGIEARTYDDAVPTAFTMPGYTLVMTAVLGVLGDGTAAYTTLYVLNLCTSLLSLVFLYLLTKRLFSTSTARVALLLAAVFPPMIAATTTFGGTTWTHLLMTAALLLLVRAAQCLHSRHVAPWRRTLPSQTAMQSDECPEDTGHAHTWWRRIPWSFVYAGLVAGAWTLFRAEALGAVVLLAVWLWWTKRGSLRPAVFYLAACLLLVLPWSIRNTVTYERVVPLTTNFWLNAWRGNHEGSTGGAFKPGGGGNWLTAELREEIASIEPTFDYELRVMDRYRERTLTFLRAHPDKAALLFVKKIAMFFSFDWSDARTRHPLFFYPQLLLIFLAFAGVVILYGRKMLPWPPLLVIVVTMVSVASLHMETRYAMMMGILYIIFAAVTIESLVGRSVKRSEE